MMPIRAILPAFLAVAAGSCAAQQESANTASTLWFACESGAAFTAIRVGDNMEVTTREATFELAPRPSSIGEKFASDDTTLIIDDVFAVLTGAPGAQFTRCLQVEGPIVDVPSTTT